MTTSIDVNYMDEPKCDANQKIHFNMSPFRATFDCLYLLSYKIQEVEDPIKFGTYSLGPNWRNKQHQWPYLRWENVQEWMENIW